MWDPFYLGFFSFECHSDDIKRAFKVAIWKSVFAFQETLRRFCYFFLLPVVHVFLGWSLDVSAAGLYLYKMYSILVQRDDIYFKMSASPVSSQYGVSKALKMPAGDVLSQLS